MTALAHLRAILYGDDREAALTAAHAWLNAIPATPNTDRESDSLLAKEAGCYLNLTAGMAWDAWQARASRPPVVASSREAERWPMSLNDVGIVRTDDGSLQLVVFETGAHDERARRHRISRGLAEDLQAHLNALLAPPPASIDDSERRSVLSRLHKKVVDRMNEPGMDIGAVIELATVAKFLAAEIDAVREAK